MIRGVGLLAAVLCFMSGHWGWGIFLLLVGISGYAKVNGDFI
jgi:hypothetical protein